VTSIFFAEEQGISASSYRKMPVVNLFGPQFDTMLQSVVKAVGSYAEIYERNVERDIPRGGWNRLHNELSQQHFPLPGFNLDPKKRWSKKCVY